MRVVEGFHHPEQVVSVGLQINVDNLNHPDSNCPVSGHSYPSDKKPLGY